MTEQERLDKLALDAGIRFSRAYRYYIKHKHLYHPDYYPYWLDSKARYFNRMQAIADANRKVAMK